MYKKHFTEFNASILSSIDILNFRNIITARSITALLLVLFVTVEFTSAQQVFERKTTDVGNIGLTITNVGNIGKPDVRNNPAGAPSFEYPLNSGQEHLFEAGIWIGARRNGADIRVSTASITDPSGYVTGKPGFEFTNNGTPIQERSSFQDSPLFSPEAVSHQDFIARFSDSRTSIITDGASIPISGHDQPLYADVVLQSYNWNFSFTEYFSILKYTITNNGQDTWDSVYVGMYADLVNRNVNSSTETGSAFFNKNGIGYLDSLYTTYVFDAGSNDQPSVNTYGGLSLIGADYRDHFFHPSNDSFLVNQGVNPPDVGPSYWLFSAGAGDFRGPADDQDRYSRMAEDFPLDQYRQRLKYDGIDAAGNYISMISMGPIPVVEPGESFDIYFAYTGALKPQEFQGLEGKRIDTTETRRIFNDNLGWVYRTFYGEDSNGNGRLDEGEDINQDGQLDRYLIPEPPLSPTLHVELEAGTATLHWAKPPQPATHPVSPENDLNG